MAGDSPRALPRLRHWARVSRTVRDERALPGMRLPLRARRAWLLRRRDVLQLRDWDHRDRGVHGRFVFLPPTLAALAARAGCVDSLPSARSIYVSRLTHDVDSLRPDV